MPKRFSAGSCWPWLPGVWCRPWAPGSPTTTHVGRCSCSPASAVSWAFGWPSSLPAGVGWSRSELALNGSSGAGRIERDGSSGAGRIERDGSSGADRFKRDGSSGAEGTSASPRPLCGPRTRPACNRPRLQRPRTRPACNGPRLQRPRTRPACGGLPREVGHADRAAVHHEQFIERGSVGGRQGVFGGAALLHHLHKLGKPLAVARHEKPHQA